MQSLGWDGKRLAREANVTESTISRLLSLHPDKLTEDCWISTLIKITKALGFRMSIDGPESMQPTHKTPDGESLIEGKRRRG